MASSRWQHDLRGEGEMGWFRRKRPDFTDVFEKIYQLMRNDEAQNLTYPEKLQSLLRSRPGADRVANGEGNFGFSFRNPIPVNGPLGEVFYLSSLETSSGVPIAFQRICSIDDAVDAFETVSCDGRQWAILFLDMYFPRKSRVAPSGYKFGDLNVIRGLTDFDEGFPRGIMRRSAEWTERRLGIALADPRLREIDSSPPHRPKAHERAISDLVGRVAGSRLDEPAETKPWSAARPSYDGSTPPEEWALARLSILVKSAARAIAWRVEHNGNPVPGHWYEAVFLSYFFVTLGLMRAEFRGDPTGWADRVIKNTLRSELAVRISGFQTPDLAISDAVRRYQSRYAEYWKHLRAFTHDASMEDVVGYAQVLARHFYGETLDVVPPRLLVILNGMALEVAEAVSSVARETARGR